LTSSCSPPPAPLLPLLPSLERERERKREREREGGREEGREGDTVTER